MSDERFSGQPLTPPAQRLNGAQRRVLVGGLLVLAGLVAWPPWIGVYAAGPSAIGYAPIWDPPSAWAGASIDLVRWLVPMAVAVVVVAGLLAVNGNKPAR